VIEHFFRRGVAHLALDDDRELAFVFQPPRLWRIFDRFLMPDQRRRRLEEAGRYFRDRQPSLARVPDVVQAAADDLRGAQGGSNRTDDNGCPALVVLIPSKGLPASA